MSYFNNNGFSQGPIHIEQGGTYLHHKVVNVWKNNEIIKQKGLVFSSTTPETLLNETNYMLLLAATPAFGTHLEGTFSIPNAPLNAVVTVEWVRNYVQSLIDFNPKDFISKSDLQQIQTQIGELNDKVEAIEPIWIQGGNAGSYK